MVLPENCQLAHIDVNSQPVEVLHSNDKMVRARMAKARKAQNSEVNARKNRSRVTNGKSLFVDFDGHGPWARRFRDILAQIIADVAAEVGGIEQLTEGQRQLARRCATISISCEMMEGKAAAGGEFNVPEYGMLTDRLGRTFQRLGLKRTCQVRRRSYDA